MLSDNFSNIMCHIGHVGLRVGDVVYFVAVYREVNETLRPETETRPGAYLEVGQGAFPPIVD